MFNDTQACIPNLDFLCILQIYLGFSTAAFLSFAALHTWALRASISSINAVVSSTSLTSFFSLFQIRMSRGMHELVYRNIFVLFITPEII